MKIILIPIIVLFFCNQVQAQLSNSGNLQAHSGASLSVAGTFANTSSAALLNNGNIYIKGNVTNNQASMSAGAGVLELNGTSAQTISGNEVFKTYNLNTNNAAGITLNNNLSISNAHTLTAGIISTSATPNFIIYEAGSTYTGDADNRHINGWVKKMGSTAFSFPVGNGTYLRKIGVTALSASAEFNCRYSGNTPNTANLEPPISSINANEHWTLNKISGGTAQAILNWENGKVAFPGYILADIRTAQYTASKWTNTGGSATGTVTNTGSITSSALSTFGQMAIGSITFPVPLNFLDISGQRLSNVIRIYWKTANEADVDHYEVQRSFDNSGFETIASVQARNIKDIQSYIHDDANAPDGKVHYRIKSVDIDGSLQLSRIVSVNYVVEGGKLTILQNPVGARIELSAKHLPSTTYHYQIFSNSGQAIKQGALLFGGSGTLTIPFQNVPSGSYLLYLKYNTETFFVKLIKN